MDTISGLDVNCFDGENYFKSLSTKTLKKRYSSLHKFAKCVAEQLGQGQSFYTFDFGDILWKAQLWKEMLPNVTPYYAVKANADPILVRLFVLLGYGFDCSTEGEIRLVMEAQGDPKKIIFAHTVKTRPALKYARSVGVDLMTFDSYEELLKINTLFPDARLVIRLKSGSMQSVYNLSKKFGCEVSEAEDLLRRAKDLNLSVVGVSFHVGGLCEEPETFTDTIDDCRRLFDIAKQLGFNFTIVDIGAGFFGSEEREGFFRELCPIIKTSLETNFPSKDVQFIAEPGCYCVASAVTLTTSIVGKKKVPKKDGGKSDIQRVYYVNDSFYASFFEHFDIYDVKPVPLLTASAKTSRPLYQSKIWGQTCCSEDIILEDCFLPDMEEEELILWKNMGAYSRGVCSNFTSVPYPASTYVFIKTPGLHLDWLTGIEKITDYILDVAHLVEREEDIEEEDE